MATILTIKFEPTGAGAGGSGYVSGGANPGLTSSIESFPFSGTFTTATDVGDLTIVRSSVAGHSSQTDGFVSGWLPTPPSTSTRIERFPFAAPPLVSTTIGTLSQARAALTGSSSDTEGFNTGGSNTGVPVSSPSRISNRIDRFPFSSPFSSSTTVGSLREPRSGAAGNSSDVNGFSSGGNVQSAPTPTFRRRSIERFPFSSPFSLATDIGDISSAPVGRNNMAGQDSDTDGYLSGGTSPSITSVIVRFPFSNPAASSSNIGNLTAARTLGHGHQSSVDGFTSGGSPDISSIDSFPFSNPFTTATSVGSLISARTNGAGHSGP